MPHITKINCYKLSSQYGNKKVFGQPKSVRSFVVVEVILNNNIRGYGESYQSAYAPEIVEIIVKFLSKYFLNKKINDALKLISKFRIPFISQTGIVKSVISSFEIGIFDAVSKYKKIPLHKLINSKSSRVRVNSYASGGSVIFQYKDLKQDIKNLTNNHFRMYKMRIGYYNFKKDLNRIKFVKKNLRKCTVMVDAIMGTLNKWSFAEVKKNIKLLNKIKLAWIEEPYPPEKIMDYKEIIKCSKNPIAIGESYTNFHEFEIAIKNNYCDIVQPDITQIGIYDCIKVIKLAKKYKKKIALHVWGSPISLLSNLHFALAFKEVDVIEYPLVKLDFLNDIIEKKIKIHKGYLSLTKLEPGMGFEIKNKDIKQKKFISNSGFKI